MKSLRSIALLALIITGCTTTSHVAIRRSAGYIISPPTSSDRSSWKLEDEHLVQLEANLGALMRTPDRRVKFSYADERRCPFPLSDYALRYRGDIERGRRIIVGKAVHKSQSGADRILLPRIAPDEGVLLEAFGGGSYYFTVTYDVAKDRIIELRYNAPL